MKRQKRENEFSKEIKKVKKFQGIKGKIKQISLYICEKLECAYSFFKILRSKLRYTTREERNFKAQDISTPSKYSKIFSFFLFVLYHTVI